MHSDTAKARQAVLAYLKAQERATTAELNTVCLLYTSILWRVQRSLAAKPSDREDFHLDWVLLKREELVRMGVAIQMIAQ